MTDLTKILNNPEDHYPGNFDTPKRANALLTGLCQDAAMEIAKLQYEVDAIPAIKEERDSLASEVLEQSRIIAMGAEREDALRAELTRLKASIALDKMSENARELGLDYEPAVQEGRDWSLLEATQESLREHMAEIKRLKAAQPAVQEPVGEVSRHHWRQGLLYRDLEPGTLLYTTPPAPQPVPVKTYHDGKPWPVAPKPWVGLTDEEMEDLWAIHSGLPLYRAIEQRLKEKNHD